MTPEKKESRPDLTSQAAATVDTAQLFGEKKLVLIRHNEDWYQLKITKQNKLILTK